VKGVVDDIEFCVVHKARIPPCGNRGIAALRENSLGLSDGIYRWRRVDALVTMAPPPTSMNARHGSCRAPRSQ
jgi:hypothetical protein